MDLPIRVYADVETLHTAVDRSLREHDQVALIAEQAASNLAVSAINPSNLLADLDWDRARKSDFELACMRQATQIGVAGHVAAREAFYAGASEFDIHMAYLQASGQTAGDLPYSNIIALNEHAGVLHYQFYDRTPPTRHRSFLIDAGGRHYNYASDITRTYAGASEDEFAQLITAMDTAQQKILGMIRPGINYLDLHEAMHRLLAQILVDCDLATGSADALFDSTVTQSFLPHGLGHLLGLQTHDVGGQQQDRSGRQQPPPDAYPALRMTREIETGQVFTIEPGLYFIPMLLDQLRDSTEGDLLNWPALEHLMGCGGIRIEDNVIVTDHGHDNLTRTAFAAHV
jgi:Xaa-Pro dipeptidase